MYFMVIINILCLLFKKESENKGEESFWDQSVQQINKLHISQSILTTENISPLCYKVFKISAPFSQTPFVSFARHKIVLVSEQHVSP